MKFLKTYKQINEGLRDMMKPKSEEEIEKSFSGLNPLDKYLLVDRYKLDKKYYPTEEEIYNYIIGLPDDEQIKKMIQFGISKEKFPRNNDGWCVYNGELKIESIYSQNFIRMEGLPNKFIINGDLIAPLSGLNELPNDLIVNGDFDCSYNMLTKLPKGLKIEKNFLVTHNEIREIPDDLIVGGVLYISDNKLPSDIKKPVGVNKMDNT